MMISLAVISQVPSFLLIAAKGKHRFVLHPTNIISIDYLGISSHNAP